MPLLVLIGVGPACVYRPTALQPTDARAARGDGDAGNATGEWDHDGGNGDGGNGDGGNGGGDDGGDSGQPGDGQMPGGDSGPFIPSNIPSIDYWSLGSGDIRSPLSAPGGINLYIDTDTGEMHLLSAGRAAGEGVDTQSGIYFEVLPQGEGLPDLGVFVLDGVDLPREMYGAPVYVRGKNALVLLVKNDVVIETTLRFLVPSGGGPAGGFVGGIAGQPGSGPCYGSGTSVGSDGAGGGGFCGSGGNGANAGGAGGGVCGSAKLVPLVGGSGGGGGAGGAGGYGGGAMQISALGSITVAATGLLTAAGQGGRKGVDPNLGGGGGGSGGAILLEAPMVEINGIVAANGGGGGTCGDDIAGNGASGVSGLGRSAGGTGCQGSGGDGGQGSGELVATGDNGEPDSGAGGGGAGRIRINSAGVVGTGVISPGLVSDCYTSGSL